MKILAVDDDESILELLPMIAAKAGFPDVSTAISGAAALDALHSFVTVFDCLLLDINMPGMDGIELCSRVRAIPTYRKTPIIMLTAMTEKRYIDSAFRAGATNYATKPFDIVELSARLRMAQELVQARMETIIVGDGLMVPSTPHNANYQFDLSEKIKFANIRDLVEYTALTNYLTQLSRTGRVSSQVVAMKVDRIETIYGHTTSDEFIYAMTEVADAIAEAIKTTDYLMAYAGNGTFVIVSNKVNLEPSITLEAEIQYALDERNSEYDNGDPLDIEISIGNPILPSGGTRGVKTTIERAISRAEIRMTNKRSRRQPISIRYR